VDDYSIQELIGKSSSVVSLFADSRKAASAAVPKKEAVDDASSSSSSSFVDAKRLNNITILLTRFKSIPLSSLREQVMSCSLSLDDCLLLQPHLPTEEEAIILSSLDGTARLALGRVETFLLQMSSVPRVANRFVCIISNSVNRNKLIILSFCLF
jgi:hypothetical protein